MQKHRESVQAGVRGTFNPAVGGDDGFIRRSSYNGEAQMAAAMADKLPPPVVCHEISYHPTLDFIILLIIHPFATYTQVDIHDYHPPKMSSDDVFFGQVRRTSETIKANPYANIPPPPVVDINDYVAPKMSSDDVFFGQKRRTSEHINANAYAHAVLLWLISMITFLLKCLPMMSSSVNKNGQLLKSLLIQWQPYLHHLPSP